MFARMFHPLVWMYFVTCAQLSASVDTEKITVESGQNATLPCRAQNNNIEVVEWSRADLKDKQYVLLYRDEQFDRTNQHPSFSNRVVLRDRQMKDGDVSFILKNVTTADAGKYECHVLLSGTNRKKRSVYDTKPIKFVDLSVDPPGQTGGAVGLKDGLSPFAVLLVAAVIL